MDNGFFQCELGGHRHRRKEGTRRDFRQGRSGNRATVKLLCESALALALNFDFLPGGARRGGILTPATALGDVVAGRLRKAGMKVEVGQ